ncbi:hypothetical protein E6C76_07655 [Pseudothauera nasutitermitis]|uniref:Uncharacterized protein n=1 Tax=Pseudothauera nasutitermitis TaxID=2565930 RepID=A0A4S4B0D3_9RHOO|nr:hypothetical protein [Pseudothauera nasutitermitis]THF65462.1 hypothetical protein E6C76_07655 [Pseudothauera nasutitermitis]
MSDLTDKARKAGFQARSLFKSALRAAGNGALALGEHKDDVRRVIGAGVDEAARSAADLLDGAGAGLSAAGRALGEGPRSAEGGLGERARDLGAQALRRSGAVLGRAAGGVAAARAAGEPIGAAAAGAFATVVEQVGGALDAAALGGEDFAVLGARIAASAERYRALMGVRGCVPGPAARMETLPARYAEWLNRGHLPAGYAAVAAAGEAAGFRIEDGAGAGNAALQRKAEESLVHVRAALARHADLVSDDVDELTAELLMRAMLERAAGDGPDPRAVERALADLEPADLRAEAPDGGWATSPAGLAFLALATFADRSRSLLERSERFGARGAEILLSAGASRLALAAGQAWWIGLLAGAGGSLLRGHGRAKRARHAALGALAEAAERVLHKLEV